MGQIGAGLGWFAEKDAWGKARDCEFCFVLCIILLSSFCPAISRVPMLWY